MALSNETHIKITIGAFISLFVFIIGSTWVVSEKFANIDNTMGKNTELIIYNQEELDEAVADVKINRIAIQLQEVKQAEINTKLANIENRQIEMIQILKENYSK